MSRWRNLKKVLYDYKLVKREGNVIWAERAFMANSATRWCINKIEDKSFTSVHVDSFGETLLAYLNGRVDLYWEGDTLRAAPPQEKKNEENA